MGKNTSIEWCHDSLNTHWGCTVVHSGCNNCYARTFANRWKWDIWGNDKPRRKIDSFFENLMKFQKIAKKEGDTHRIFIGSMMDIFEKPMPMIDSDKNILQEKTDVMRKQLFANIDADMYPDLLLLFLTKRPSNIRKYIPTSWHLKFPKNEMLGTSISDQKSANKFCDQLLNSVDDGHGQFFVSVEPQLDWIDLSKWLYNRYLMGGDRPMYNQLHWVITGGESGHGRRPYDTNWGRKLRNDCAQAKVAFFFKQIDKVIEKKEGIPTDLRIQQFPNLDAA